jgi:GAF domain-containing protein
VAQSSALNLPPETQSHASTRSTNDVLRERRVNLRLHLAAMRLQQTTGAAGVAIALTDDGTALVCRAAAGSLLEDVGRRISLSHGLAAECLISGRLQWSGNTVRDPRVDDALCRELGIRSIAVVPVRVGDALVGILQFLYRQPYAFGARELVRLEDLAQTVLAQIDASTEDLLGSPVPPLGNDTSRSVRPYGSIILIAAFLLFTLIVIRATYIARYVGTIIGSVHVE